MASTGVELPVTRDRTASARLIIATMPHNSRKKRAGDEYELQHSSAPDRESRDSEQAPDHTARDAHRGEPQVPFYDDHNHVAYGWQQMSILPGLHHLVGGTADDPPLFPQSRPQTWPFRSSGDSNKDEPSGFNPRPLRGQVSRRPRPLPQSEGTVGYSRRGKRESKSFVDPSRAKEEDANAGADDVNDRPNSLVLAPKTMNQKLSGRRSQVPSSLIFTDGCGKRSQLRSKKFMADGLEVDRGAERMGPLDEEPAPPKIRKKHAETDRAEPHSTLEQSCLLRAGLQQPPTMGKDGDFMLHKDRSEQVGIGSLMAAITEQLSAFTVRSEPQFEHRSAVPKPSGSRRD